MGFGQQDAGHDDTPSDVGAVAEYDPHLSSLNLSVAAVAANDTPIDISCVLPYLQPSHIRETRSSYKLKPWIHGLR